MHKLKVHIRLKLYWDLRTLRLPTKTILMLCSVSLTPSLPKQNSGQVTAKKPASIIGTRAIFCPTNHLGTPPLSPHRRPQHNPQRRGHRCSLRRRKHRQGQPHHRAARPFIFLLRSAPPLPRPAQEPAGMGTIYFHPPRPPTREPQRSRSIRFYRRRDLCHFGPPCVSKDIPTPNPTHARDHRRT